MKIKGKTFKERKLNRWFWLLAIFMSVIYPLYRITKGTVYPETYFVIPVACIIIGLCAKKFGFPRWPIKEDSALWDKRNLDERYNDYLKREENKK